MTVRGALLDDAKKIVEGERGKDYGNVTDNFMNTIALWEGYLNSKFNTELEMNHHDFPVMMILAKIARIIESPYKRDNWLDIAGYAACGWESADPESRRLLSEQRQPSYCSRGICALEDGHSGNCGGY